jgi:hypothetical protein
MTEDAGPTQVLKILLEGATQADLQAMRGEAAAINNAAGVINRRLQDVGQRLLRLQKRIARMRILAIVLKGVAVLGAVVILSGQLPDAVPIISLAIAIASSVDLLLGNHRRLIGLLDEKSGLETLQESVEDAETAGTSVLRLVGTDWREAVKKYAEFMHELQTSILKSYKEVNAASRSLERDVAATLEVAQATATSGAADKT